IYNKITYISHNNYHIQHIYQHILIKFYPPFQKFHYQQPLPIQHYIYFLIPSVKYHYLTKLKPNYKPQPLLLNQYILQYNPTFPLNHIQTSIITKQLTLPFKTSQLKLTPIQTRIIPLLLNHYNPNQIPILLNLQSK
ncbi:RNA polymerase sigma factor, partial [Staphylococcus epidermidis]|uniref:RNA polymerase sigma factor n=1 Tax=Staphylococcus epidermidis TaxID=1282 RepID=UPI0028CB6370